MTTEFPCTHPDNWPCKHDESGACVTEATYGRWIEQKVAADSAGTGTYFNPDPRLVGDVDMALGDSRKLPLGLTGNSEEVPLPADFNDVPNVDERALVEWQQRKQR